MALIILDRDGVINEDSDDYIKSPEEWHAIPGSLEAIARLSHEGHTVAIATNQSGIGRAYYSLETLHAIHQKMLDAIAEKGGEISALVFCPHVDDDRCDCRKPKPGLFYQIANTLQADLSDALVVGDAWRDIEAGISVNAKTALVLTGKGIKTAAKYQAELELSHTLVAPNLSVVVDQFLRGLYI